MKDKKMDLINLITLPKKLLVKSKNLRLFIHMESKKNNSQNYMY